MFYIKSKIFVVVLLGVFILFPLCDSTSAEDSKIQESKYLKQSEELKKVEKLYDAAVYYYEKGKVKKADKYYRKSMKKLYSIMKNGEISYQLREEFDVFFYKLNNVLNGTSYEDAVCDEGEAGSKSETEDSKEGIRKRYTIPLDKQNRLVQEYIRRYTEGKEKAKIVNALERSGRYREMILGILKEYELPEELIYLPVVESLYKIRAYSRAKASGLWQLMPHTGRSLGLKVNYWIDERRDPEKATRAAVKYLRDLYIHFNDWHLALASYNRGEYGLSRDLKFSRSANFNQLSNRDAVPSETERFVPKFIAVTLIGENHEEYGYRLDFNEPLVYDKIIIDKVIDLEIVAKCAESTLSEIRELNPSLNAWCTPINYPDFELKLPSGKKGIFMQNIVKVKDLNPSRGFIRYRIRKGDCLSKIAKKYHTNISSIKRYNKIRNANRIAVNQILLIKPGRKYFSN